MPTDEIQCNVKDNVGLTRIYYFNSSDYMFECIPLSVVLYRFQNKPEYTSRLSKFTHWMHWRCSNCNHWALFPAVHDDGTLSTVDEFKDFVERMSKYHTENYHQD